MSLHRAGRLSQAEQIYLVVLAVEPRNFDCLHNLSLIRRQQGRLDEALALAARAHDADPRSPRAHDTLGSTLLRNRPEEAIAAYDQAIALKPDFAEAHSNLAGAFAAQNRTAGAIASYRRALGYNPALAEVQYYESLEHLRLGDFATGWRQHEWRWLRRDAAPFRRNFAQPIWLGGESLKQKTILLHADQGMGCALQFVRYVPLVAELGAEVVVEVQRPLLSLIKQMPGASGVYARGDPLPPFDRHCPLMMLPLAFGTTLDSIPARVPYIPVPSIEVAGLLDKTAGAAPSVGLVWAGNAAHANDHNRSIPLRRLLPPLERRGVNFVSLQQPLRDGDARILDAAGVRRVGERLQDFAETAAVVSRLDLVITVDTAVAHLAGALGKPVWVLLSFATDWRWFLARDDSPFYPTARLFRQPAPGDWDTVASRVGAALSERGKAA